jgi:putative SOS response-associated peptidase YedK
MCARFTLTRPDLSGVARLLGAEVDPADVAAWRPRYNVAPSQQAFVARAGGRRPRLQPARFGFPGRQGQLVVNARFETAGRLPMFRQAFREGRCVVPSDGFYEWRRVGGRRLPLWYHRPDGGLVLMAGLVRSAADGQLEFVILTAPANGEVRGVHDRMPALLSPEEAAAWLARPELALLRPAPEGGLVARPVSPRANSVANDDPDCLAPPPSPRQLGLF